MPEIDLTSGRIGGKDVTTSARTIADLAGVFMDEAARAAMDQSFIAYRVESYEPQPEGTEGAVCCATTFLSPGSVGDEYFMTRGHFHANQDRPEMELTISGEGALILMSRDRRTWIEPLRPGSIHHVPPATAHRVANTGDEPLVFVSFWPSETGHDYETIRNHGFGARLRRVGGKPALVTDDR